MTPTWSAVGNLVVEFLAGGVPVGSEVEAEADPHLWLLLL